MSSSAIVGLAAAADPGRFGGKAAALARALAAGLPVPAGFALDSHAVRNAATDALDSDERAALETELARLGDVSLAVRSSAIGEDSRAASFAGQHVSVLNVRGRDGALQSGTSP